MDIVPKGLPYTQSRAPAKAVLITCFALVGATLPSCQKSKDEIAVIPETTATIMYEAEAVGAELAARKYGVQFRWNAPERADDIQAQIGLVDRAVKERCRGLIVWPDEPSALMVPVQRAVAAGVPTVVVGSALSLPPRRNLSYIVNDDELTGRIAAGRIGERLQGKGQVAVVGIHPQSLSSLALLSSFESLLEQRFPGISIVDRKVAATTDLDSELVVNQVLLTYPQVNAIFALDSTGAVGAYLALQTHSWGNRVKVVGVEQTYKLVNAVRSRQIDSILAKDSYQMGYRALECLVTGQVKTPGTIKLAPMLVTADNVDSAAVRPFVTVDWSPRR